MAKIASFIFNPKIVTTSIDRSRFSDLLPGVHQTQSIVNFANSSINNLFTKGSGTPLNGYIGDVPSWNNPVTDHYISEIDGSRQFYQLSASMVSYDDTSDSYQSVLNYPDYVSTLKTKGAIVSNENRLFSSSYYTWCPSIDLDKFINYRLYLWISYNSDPSVPDYITIDKTASNKNPWSLSNNWIHSDDYSEEKYPNTTATKAERAIVEFFPNLELYEYGVFRRKDVNLVWTDSSGYNGIVGKDTVTIDGVLITKQSLGSSVLRVLITNDQSNTNYSNKIFSLFYNGKVIQLSLESDGISDTGIETSGEIIKVLDGDTYTNKELYYDGTNWVAAQTKQDVNQFPLFQLYDSTGTALTDTSKYPNTNFSGNRLFNYNDSGTTTDTVLGINLTYDVYGQIQFKNYLVSTVYEYSDNQISYDIDGYYFYNDYDVTNNKNILKNDWYISPNVGKQYVTDSFVADGYTYIFDISQTPDKANNVYDVSVTLTRTQNNKTTSSVLKYGSDYLINNKQILIPSVIKGDNIVVKTFSSTDTGDKNGYYDVPDNISANPNNNDIMLVSIGDVYNQFVEVIEGQSGYTGSYYDSNNYRNTSKSPIYGTSIIQTKENLLLPMFLESSQILNMIDCIEYSKYQYRIFRNRFEKKITEYLTKGLYKTDITLVDNWVTNALKDISRGLTKSSPFFNSGVGRLSDSEPEWFIPPTPSYLGFYDLIVPAIITDGSVSSTQNMIRCHDNAIIPCFGDFRDQVLLSLETRIYNSANSKFKDSGYTLAGNYKEIISLYSNSEWSQLLQGFYQTWCSKVNVDSRTNSTYSNMDPFTWNWSTVISNIDGDLLPGAVRGIFLKYYNTVTPHTTPWQMLGLDTKPSWWDSSYGSAPYTDTNMIMWNDIKSGYIRGTKTYSEFSYSYILDYIPVDSQGYLKDPYQIGIAKSYPPENQRSDDWSFGDIGPVEYAWRCSSEYGFSVIEAAYLGKPSKIINECWDTVNIETLMSGEISEQTIQTLVNRRPHYSDYYIHNELIDNEYIQRIGIQQYVSYYLMSDNKDITTSFGDYVRNLDTRLSYKMAGFTDSSSLTITSDSSDIIPSENYSVVLYRSPLVSRYYYSGLIIVRVSGGYKIYGYDNSIPNFNVYELNTLSSYETIGVASTIKHRISSWKSNVYYPKGSVVSYGEDYYMAESSISASNTFIASKWVEVNRPDVSSYTTVNWYSAVSSQDTTTIPYGTLFKSTQEVANFLNGYQKYLENSGFDFNTTLDDNTTLSDFKESLKTFLKWVESGLSNNDFLVVSPLSSSVEFNTAIGEVSNIEKITNSSYGIVNKSGSNIPGNELYITRNNGDIKVEPISDEIYGLRIEIFEQEHVLIVDNKTVFGDIIYNPTYNIKQDRLKLNGFKTSDWDGRYSAPGFIITGDSIVPNFETSADQFRSFYDTIYSFDDELQLRAWNNIGFQLDNDLTALSLTTTNQLAFYQGSIQNKGTSVVLDRLMSSTFISNDNSIDFHEEWLFRTGDYGAAEINKSFDFNIKQSDFVNEPQLIEFNSIEFNDEVNTSSSYSVNGSGNETITFDVTNFLEINLKLIEIQISGEQLDGVISLEDSSGNILLNDLDISNIQYYVLNDVTLETNTFKLVYDVKYDATISISISGSVTPNITISNTTNVITLNDVVSSNTNKILSKDSRWNWRLFGKEVEWSTKDYYSSIKNLPCYAGYVNIDTVDFFTKDANSFDTKFFDELVSNPSTTITNEITFDASEIDSNNVLLKNLISGTESGWFRVNYMMVEVTTPFTVPVTINIGRKDQLPDGVTSTYSSDVISRITYQDLQSVTTLYYYPSKLWNLDDVSNNTVFAQFCYGNITSATSKDDKICYDKVISYDSSSVSNRVGSVTITIHAEKFNGSMVPNDRLWIYRNNNGTWETKKLQNDGDIINTVRIPTYVGQGAIVSLEEVSDISIYDDETIPFVLTGIQNISPDISQNVYAKTSNTRSVVVSADNPSVDILELYSDSQMNITSFTLDITEPFVANDGTTIGLDIGTSDNSSMMAASSVISNPAPSIPSFDSSTPVTVNVANQEISAFRSSGSIPVDIIRSGNIYGLPNTCSDIQISTVSYEVYPVDADGNYLDVNGNIVTSKVVIQSGTLTYGSPDNSSDTMLSYWDIKAVINYNLDTDTSSDTSTLPVLSNTLPYLRLDITGATEAVVGSTSYSLITLVDDDSNDETNYINPGVVGTSNLNFAYYNMNAGDNMLTATVTNAKSGSATITVQYTFLNGFEIYDSTGSAIATSVEGNGGNIFRYQTTRFNDDSDLASSTNKFITGDVVEVDNNDSWEIKQYDGSKWNTIWTKQNKVDIDNFKDAIVYNDSSEVEVVTPLYDPLKGKYPAAIKNIDMIQGTDPALYNTNSNGSTSSRFYWGDNMVGKLWWDTSTVFYLDYENFSQSYKTKNWGYILPNSSVDVYQWVKSPVTPSSWNSYVASGISYNGFDVSPSGTVPSDLTDFNWVEETQYNDIIESTQTVYYFWVKGATVVNESLNKTISAYGLQELISDIKSSNISYYSVIDTNKVLVGQISEYIKSDDCSIKFRWDEDSSDGQYHKQWEIVTSGSSDIIPSSLWTKMTQSLVGWNIFTDTNSYEFTTTNDVENGKNIIKIGYNSNTANIPPYGILKIQNDWYQYSNFSNLEFTVDAINGSYPSGSSILVYVDTTNYVQVPDSALTSFESNGNLIRPSQTWYPTTNDYSSRYARRLFVQKFNNLMASTNILDQWDNWESVFATGEKEPDSSMYSYSYSDYSDMVILGQTSDLKIGTRILLTSGYNSYGFWLLYEYNPYDIKSDTNGFVIVDSQKWRLQDGELWNSVDWYSTGYDITDLPQYTFDDYSTMITSGSTLDVTLFDGTLVKVNQISDTEQKWAWYVYDGTNYNLVAKEKSTIELSSLFYTSTIQYGIDNNFDVSVISQRDGTYELKFLLESIYTSMMSDEMKNDLFFTMVKASFSLNTHIDWAIKSSFMYMGGYKEQLSQTPIDFESHVDNITNYMDKIKPYHVKLRDYVNAVSYGPDIANITITDFDFPSYPNGASYRVLDPSVQYPLNHKSNGNVTDTTIVTGNIEWSYWYDNYLNTNYDINSYNENWNPIRKKYITMTLDRVEPNASEFGGTIVKSPEFTNGDYSEFPYSYYGGYENELNYYTGDTDTNSPVSTNASTQPSGETPILDTDVTHMDFDIENSNNINDDNYTDDSIEVTGNNLIQPRVDIGHPEELYPVDIDEAFKIISTNKAINQKYMILKDTINNWEFIDMSSGYGSLMEDDTTSIKFDTNGHTFHDPNNPSQDLLDKVKLTYVELGWSDNDINTMIGRKFPGVIYLNGERILYWDITQVTGNVYTISNIQRSVNGFVPYKSSALGDEIYDGSVLSWVTMDNMSMIYNKNVTPTVDYTLDANIWKLGNLSICYNK